MPMLWSPLSPGRHECQQALAAGVDLFAYLCLRSDFDARTAQTTQNYRRSGLFVECYDQDRSWIFLAHIYTLHRYAERAYDRLLPCIHVHECAGLDDGDRVKRNLSTSGQ